MKNVHYPLVLTTSGYNQVIDKPIILTTSGYNQMIDKPTHYINESSSCIDLILKSYEKSWS